MLRIIRLCLVLLFVLPFTIIAQSEPIQQIAFVAVLDGSEDIIVQTTPNTFQNVTNTTARDWHPEWSPDGMRILFTSNRTGDDELFVMNADGSDVQNLTMARSNESAGAWSPDGNRIVFASDRDGGVDLYILDTLSGGVTRLTNDAVEKSAPSWSPDGLEIIYWITRQETTQLFAINVNTGNRQILVEDGPVDWASWSPDGSRLVYHKIVDNRAQIMIYDLNTMTETVLSTPDAEHNDLRPVWSPDGNQIAFMSNRTGIFGIYVMNADGSNVAPYATSSETIYHSPAWRPVFDGEGNLVNSGFGQSVSMSIDSINPDSQEALGEATVDVQYPSLSSIDDIIRVRVNLTVNSGDDSPTAPAPDENDESIQRDVIAYRYMGAKLNGFDLSNFDILPEETDYLLRIRTDKPNYWEWWLRPTSSHAIGTNILSIQLYAPAFFDDGSVGQDVIETIVFRLEISDDSETVAQANPVNAELNMPASIVLDARNEGQAIKAPDIDALNIRILYERSSITVYSLNSTNLQDVSIRSRGGAFGFDGFSILSALGFETSPSMCLRFEDPSAANPSPPPSVCSQQNTFLQALNPAEIFWYDNFNRQLNDLIIFRGEELIGYCPANIMACDF